MFFFDLSSYLQTSLLIGKSAQYYHAIAEALVLHLGYQRGINLHGAPYDFRKAASKLLLFCSSEPGRGRDLDIFTFYLCTYLEVSKSRINLPELAYLSNISTYS